MRKDEKTKSLVKRLQEIVGEERQREAARLIERAASDVLGESNFVFRREAELMALLSNEQIDKLLAEVKNIKDNLELEYAEATLALGDE